MPKVLLHNEDLEGDQLPKFCMRCGNPATVVRRHRFSWAPEWLTVLILVGLLVSAGVLLVALLLAPFIFWHRTVPLQLCEQHRNHGRYGRWFLLGGLALFAFLVVLSITLVTVSGESGSFLFNLGGGLCAGSVLVFLFTIIPALYLQQSGIRATHIDDKGIALAGVSHAFVDEYDERERKRRLYGRGDV